MNPNIEITRNNIINTQMNLSFSLFSFSEPDQPAAVAAGRALSIHGRAEARRTERMIHRKRRKSRRGRGKRGKRRDEEIPQSSSWSSGVCVCVCVTHRSPLPFLSPYTGSKMVLQKKSFFIPIVSYFQALVKICKLIAISKLLFRRL